jgi:type IV pilus assembly protein PilQ
MPLLLLALLPLAAAGGPQPAPTVDVSFAQTDVHAALRFLAESGDVNIVVGDDVSGTVTLDLHKVSWDEAFYAVLAQKGLTATLQGSTYDIHRR